MIRLHPGDNMEALRRFPSASVDAVVADPPYGLGTPPDPLEMLCAWMTEGHLDVRGRGFMGREWDAFVPQPATRREVLRVLKPGGYLAAFFGTRTYDVGTLALRLAGFEIRDQLAWVYGQGWPKSPTSLKPSFEPIALARRPGPALPLGIDACRVEAAGATTEGRWPANLVHDGSPEVLELFPHTKSGKPGIMRLGVNTGSAYGTESQAPGTPMTGFGDEGSAARFFYCAKASPTERAGSRHPTIKPVALMRWLCRLITPPGGTVLDPFAGSGTTGEAARAEGFDAILMEREPEFIADIERRLGIRAGRASLAPLAGLIWSRLP